MAIVVSDIFFILNNFEIVNRFFDLMTRGVTQSLRQGGVHRQYLKIWKQGGRNMLVRMDLSLKYSQKRNFFHFFEQRKQNFQKQGGLMRPMPPPYLRPC